MPAEFLDYQQVGVCPLNRKLFQNEPKPSGETICQNEANQVLGVLAIPNEANPAPTDRLPLESLSRQNEANPG